MKIKKNLAFAAHRFPKRKNSVSVLLGNIFLLNLLLASFVLLPASPNTAYAAVSNLQVDGSQTFQKIDGLGVNINVHSWDNGAVIPALNLLTDNIVNKHENVCKNKREN